MIELPSEVVIRDPTIVPGAPGPVVDQVVDPSVDVYQANGLARVGGRECILEDTGDILRDRLYLEPLHSIESEIRRQKDIAPSSNRFEGSRGYYPTGSSFGIKQDSFLGEAGCAPNEAKGHYAIILSYEEVVAGLAHGHDFTRGVVYGHGVGVTRGPIGVPCVTELYLAIPVCDVCKGAICGYVPQEQPPFVTGHSFAVGRGSPNRSRVPGPGPLTGLVLSLVGKYNGVLDGSPLGNGSRGPSERGAGDVFPGRARPLLDLEWSHTEHRGIQIPFYVGKQVKDRGICLLSGKTVPLGDTLLAPDPAIA